MSQESVEAVKAMWPAGPVELVEMFRRFEAAPPVLDAMGADTEIVFRPIAPGPSNPAYHGVEGLAEGWLDWLEAYESYWLEVEDFIDAGDGRVLMPARAQARTARDGVLIEHEPAAVCTITNGRIAQITFYLDRAEAFAVRASTTSGSRGCDARSASGRDRRVRGG